MDNFCSEFGDFTFSRFGFIARTNKQTDRICCVLGTLAFYLLLVPTLKKKKEKCPWVQYS